MHTNLKSKIKETFNLLLKKRKPVVLVFGSFVHGSGKSYLRKTLEYILRDLGYSVFSLSTGDIFREIAEEEGKTIEELVKELQENPYLDLKIDKRIYTTIKNLLAEKKFDIILIDSNLAPYYLEDAIKILVVANLNKIVDRVFRNPRKSEKFQSRNEVMEKLIERSIIDKKRYKRLSKIVTDPFWKKIYSSYGKNVFDFYVDNSYDIWNTISQLVQKLRDLIK